MDISDEVTEAFARSFHHDWDYHTQEPWRSLGLERIRTALKAAAPILMAEAWNEGHEEGFWNGRLSSGDTTGVPLIGKDHAAANNPYRPSERDSHD